MVTPMVSRTQPALRAAVFSTFLMACGASSPRTVFEAADYEDLTEGRATEICLEVAADRQLDFETGWVVDLGRGSAVPVDLRVSGTDFGLEWVTPADRSAHGSLLPEPAEGDQLVLAGGAGVDAEAQILVLDHRSYRFHPDPGAVQRGAIGVREAEARLAKDVREFLTHVEAVAPLPSPG